VFEDYLQLDLSPEAKLALEEFRTRIITRQHKASEARRQLTEAMAAIAILIADGHPAEILGSADIEVIQELDARLDALLRTRGLFRGSEVG